MNAKNENNIKGHEGRDDLAGEHKYGDLGQIIIVLLFFAALGVDLIWLNLCDQIHSAVPFMVRIPLSLPFFILSFYLIKMSHKEIFATKRDQMTIIQTGVYGLVRHPMYLSTIVLCLAVLILSLSILSFIIWTVLLVFYVFIARFEEQLMISKLGDEYINYRKKVPMFIPGLKRRK